MEAESARPRHADAGEPLDDAIAFDLRYASRLVAAAMARGVASEAALNALDAVAVSLDRRTFTQEMIDTARLAVAAVLNQIQPVAEAIG